MNKKIIIFLILIFLLFFSFNVFSIDESLFVKDHLVLESNISGYFVSNYDYNSKFSFLKFYFSSFPKKEYYDVLKQTFYPNNFYYDKNNDSVVFEWNNLEKNYFFNINTIFKNTYFDSNVKKKYSYYEYKNSIPKKFLEYTESTELIDSDNKNIKSIAVKLAEGSNSFLDLEKKIIEYVNSRVEYNLSTINVEGTFKASEVLERKQGVCDEITILFIALNRALGIPSRYVSGYSFSDLFSEEGSWLGHSWAEVYYDGEWIPFDLTYQEYLHLDPLHVAFKKTKYPSRNDNNYEWKGYNVNINLERVNYDFKILSRGKNISLGSIKSKVLKNNIGEGSYNVLEINVKNNNDFIIMPVIKVGETRGLEFYNNSKIAVLYPYEEKKVYFLFRIKSVLEENYIYTFPIIIYSSGFEDNSVEFKAEKNSYVYSKSDFEKYFLKEKNVFFEKVKVNCDFKSFYKAESYNNVSCIVKNEGNKNYNLLSLCLDFECKNFDLNINEEKKVILKFKTKQGLEKKVLRLKENNKILYYKKVNFNSIKEPKINFTTRIEDDILKINFSSDKNVEGNLTIKLNGRIIKKYVFKTKSFNKSISLKEKSIIKNLVFENNIKVILEYETFNEKKVYEKKEKYILKKDFENIILLFYNKILLLFN